MTEQEFFDNIISRLGGNLIDVELETSDLRAAFRNAKRVMQQRGNNNMDRKFYALSVVTGQTEYPITDEAIRDIVEVIQPSGGFYSNDPFSIAMFNDVLSGLHGGETDLLTFEMSKWFLERIRRMIAQRPQFIWNPRNRTIKFLKTPRANEAWFLECYADLSDEEYRDNLWIEEWTLAEAKLILGNAYRKFNSLSTPAGDNGLEGSSMIQEAKEKKKELLEDILDYVDGDPTGGYIEIG